MTIKVAHRSLSYGVGGVLVLLVVAVLAAVAAGHDTPLPGTTPPPAPATSAGRVARAQADLTSLLESVGDLEQGCLSHWSQLSAGVQALLANGGTGGALLVGEATAAEPDCNTALSGVSSTSVPDSLRGYSSVVTWLRAAQDQVSALWDAVSSLEQLGRTLNQGALHDVTIALEAVTRTTGVETMALVQAKHDLNIP
jgi:hypothetical protein